MLSKNLLFTILKKKISKFSLVVINSRSVATKNVEQNKDLTKFEQKSIRVAVLGVPNTGKSTFINNLINRRVCPTSCKVHTTRNANKAIYTVKETQIVLFDTPGLVSDREIKKHNLESSFEKAYRDSLKSADLCCVVHDVSNSWTRKELHPTVLSALQTNPNLPSFLVLNKIDLLKSKRILLDLVKTLTNNTLTNKKKSQKILDVDLIKKSEEKSVGWSNFSEIFMVSSILGDGLNEVLNAILNKSVVKPWEFSSNSFTNLTPDNLIVDSVRARLLDYLPQEIPYSLRCELEYYSEENNTIFTSVIVHCPSARIEKLICGESNGKLKQISERIISDLVETFGKAISLTLVTKSKNSESIKL